jgi:tRNA(His) 5'-end guanylyltransferase
VLSALSARLTESFQRELRNSELWEQMVAEFGEQRAEELLRECKADVKPGLVPDGSGDRPTDLS